jgi:phage N-6-adenine-methyltransferase
MANDTWATPNEVFDTLDFEFMFELDVCAEHSTAKCDLYWTVEDDALTTDWVSLRGMIDRPGDDLWLWCNPPYSKIGPWVEKAIEAQLGGVGVVMLVMCDPSVKWFSRALEYCSEVRYITNGRLSFLNNGVRQTANNKGSVIFVFNPVKIGACETKYIDRSTFGV